jgi:hypothetical protein
MDIFTIAILVAAVIIAGRMLIELWHIKKLRKHVHSIHHINSTTRSINGQSTRRTDSTVHIHETVSQRAGR